MSVSKKAKKPISDKSIKKIISGQKREHGLAEDIPPLKKQKAEKNNSKKQIKKSFLSEEEANNMMNKNLPKSHKKKKPVLQDDNTMEVDEDSPIKKTKTISKEGTKGFMKPSQVGKKRSHSKEEPMDTDEVKKSTKKPFMKVAKDGFKKFKKPGHQEEKKIAITTKKERQAKKRERRQHPELAYQMLKLWEELRREDTAADRRLAICDKLTEIVKGKVRELVSAHDTSRVFESLIMHGKEQHRWQIFEELKSQIVEIAMDKYSKFIVLKMLTYGNKSQKEAVFVALEGKVCTLLRHKHASELVELAYNDYATAPRRASMVQEMYGPGFALFRLPNVTKVEEAIQLDPTKKNIILDNLRKAIVPSLEKGLQKHSLVQHVLYEYLSQLCAPGETQYTEKIAEVVEALKENIVPLLHTREGVKCAMLVLWQASAKDRKIIIKSLKSAVENICKDEHGYLFMIALIECVDDTVMMNKLVFKEMCESLVDLAENKHSRKVLFSLVCPRDATHFPVQLRALLSPGDTNPHSRKERNLRETEIRVAMAHAFFAMIIKHAERLIKNNSTVLLVAEILTKCPESTDKCGSTRADALQAVALLLNSPFVQGDDHLVDLTASHILLRKLTAAKDIKVEFGRIVMKTVSHDVLRSWTKINRGSFFLVNLYDTEDSEIRSTLVKALRPIFSQLTSSTLNGAQVLYSKLK